MLIEHDRYFYQRKVPLEFQRAVGRKKWRAPLGSDFEIAFEKLKELRNEHDALLERLKCPEESRDHIAKTRRKREENESKRIADEEAAYEKWCHAQGAFTEQEEHREDEEPAWENAERWIAALEFERTRDHSPTDEELKEIEDLLGRLERSDGDFKVELPPHPQFKALVGSAVNAAKSKITFLPFVPEAMDDDEYHDRLVDVFNRLFGEDIKPPTDPDDRDAFDFAKMKLERRIARVARDPDTISKVASKFYAFAQLREKTQNKYERTIGRLTKELGDLPVSQVTPRMLRDYRDHLKNKRRILPSSIRAEFTPIMGLFGYAVDEELIEI